MTPFKTPSLGTRNLGLAGLLFASGLFAVTFASPTAWLQSGFDAAINTTDVEPVAIAQSQWTAPIAGSEEYWLGAPTTPDHHDMMQPAAWHAPLAKGDRFTISSDGSAREFEVVKVEPLLNAVSDPASDKTTGQKTQLLVQCRSTDRNHPETVKFIVDEGAGLPWATPVKQHAAHAL